MTLVFQDSFTNAGTVNVDIESHTPDTGTGWVEVINTGTITVEVEPGGQVINQTNSPSDAYFAKTDPAASEADVDAIFEGVGDLSGSDDPVGVIARYQDANNYIGLARYRDSRSPDVYMFESVSGTITQLGSGVDATDRDNPFKLELRGSTAIMYEDTGSGFVALETVTVTGTLAGDAGLFIGNMTPVSTDDARNTYGLDFFQLDEFASGGGGGSILPQMLQHDHFSGGVM